jgi:hypothetical protein
VDAKGMFEALRGLERSCLMQYAAQDKSYTEKHFYKSNMLKENSKC